MLPCAVFSGFGMFFFGYTMAHGSNAILCAFFQGMMMVGVMIGVVATMSYGLDAFRSQSNEIFVMNMVFKVRAPVHLCSLHCVTPKVFSF
jgi:hypothetical protein